MIANKYYQGNTREICHGIKEMDIDCMNTMIEFILNNKFIKKGDILIPAPQHQGYAIYTKYIAEEIAKETGAIVKDVVKSKPREMLYKNRNINLNFYTTEILNTQNTIFFVDNVISTGKTLNETSKLFGRYLEPLVYGII